MIILVYIDMKVRLLPNSYVFAFAVFGLCFHLSTELRHITPADAFLGILTGGGLLFAVRFFANAIYKQDTLGLGDVKLMMAGGLWLGGHFILNAIIIGACAGILHGIAIAFLQWRQTGKKVNFSHLSLPAGPGFIIGIILAGMIKFLA